MPMVQGSLKTNKLTLQGHGEIGTDVTMDVNDDQFQMKMGNQVLMTVDTDDSVEIEGNVEDHATSNNSHLTFAKDSKFQGNVEVEGILTANTQEKIPVGLVNTMKKAMMGFGIRNSTEDYAWDAEDDDDNYKGQARGVIFEENDKSYAFYNSHPFVQDRIITQEEYKRENMLILNKKSAGELTDESSYGNTSDNWMFSLTSNKAVEKGFYSFYDIVANWDAEEGYFNDTTRGTGKAGNICDIYNPLTGYKLRFYAVPYKGAPGTSYGEPYDSKKLNPGPDYFMGQPGLIADDVIGVMMYLGFGYFEFCVFLAIIGQGRGFVHFDFTDGVNEDFPSRERFEELKQTRFSRIYENFYADGSGIYNMYLNSSVNGPNQDAYYGLPVFKFSAITWKDEQGNPTWDDASRFRPYDCSNYNRDTDYNPIKEGLAKIYVDGVPTSSVPLYVPGTPVQPHPSLRPYTSNCSAATQASLNSGNKVDGLDNPTVHLPKYSASSYAVQGSFQGHHVLKIDNDYTMTQVGTVDSAQSAWHDVRTYQCQTAMVSGTPESELIPYKLYDIMRLGNKLGTCQFLTLKDSKLRVKSPYKLKKDDVINGLTMSEDSKEVNLLFTTGENKFSGINVTDLSPLRVEGGVIDTVNKVYGDIQPGNVLNSGAKLPVTYTSPYSFANTKDYLDPDTQDFYLTSCHNIYVDELKGLLVGVGSGAQRGLYCTFFDLLHDEGNVEESAVYPKFVGETYDYDAHDWVNMTYTREEALKYLGYELEEGRETLTLGCVSNGYSKIFTIYDMDDMTYNPDNKGLIQFKQLASCTNLPISFYSHQAVFTTDKRYLIGFDEYVAAAPEAPKGGLDNKTYDVVYVMKPYYDASAQKWHLDYVQNLTSGYHTKVHQGFCVNESDGTDSPWEDWIFYAAYAGGLNIKSIKYNENFPVDFVKQLDNEGNVEILPSNTEVNYKASGDKPFMVEHKGFVRAKVNGDISTADWTGSWGCCPYSRELDTKASERYVVFDTINDVIIAKYEEGNTKEKIAKRLEIDVSAGKRLQLLGKRDLQIELVNGLYSTAYVEMDNKLIKFPGDSLAYNVALDMDVRMSFPFVEADNGIKQQLEGRTLATSLPEVNEKVYILQYMNDKPANKQRVLAGTVMNPSESDFRVFSYWDMPQNLPERRKAVEFVRKSEIIVNLPGVEPGMSGSPVFNANGEIIGIIRDKIEGTDNVGITSSVVLRNLLQKTEASLNKYWTQTINTTGFSDVVNTPNVNDQQSHILYADSTNNVMNGFASTGNGGQLFEYIIDPVSKYSYGDGTYEKALKPIDIMGRVGTTGSFDAAVDNTLGTTDRILTSIIYGHDGWLMPYMKYPIDTYTPGVFSLGETLIAQKLDVNGNVEGDVGKFLFCGDSSTDSSIEVNKIKLYPRMFKERPYYEHIDGGVDGDHTIVLTNGTSAVTITNGFVIDPNEYITPFPDWCYVDNDKSKSLDQSKFYLRRSYNRPFDTVLYYVKGNNIEDDPVIRDLSAYNFPVKYFSTKTIDSASGVSSSILKTSDRVVFGLNAFPLTEESAAMYSSRMFPSDSDAYKFGVSISPDSIIIDFEGNRSVIVQEVPLEELEGLAIAVNVDSTIENKHSAENKMQPGDMMLKYKLATDADYKIFNYHTWFLDATKYQEGDVLDVIIARPTGPRSWEKLTIQRTMFETTQSQLHSI